MPKNVFAGVGVSKKDDPFEAGKEAVSNAIENMKKSGGEEPNFGLVFCSGGKYGKDDSTIQKFVDGVHSVFKKFKNCDWTGCTTSGEISPFGSEKNSVSVLVINSEHLKFSVGIGNNVFKEPKKAGIEATEQAFSYLKLDPHVDAYMQYMRYRKRKPSEIIKMVPYAIILLGKGPEKGLVPKSLKLADLQAVLDGIIETCGTQIPIVGGGSFDDWRLTKNYHFSNGKVYNDSIIVVAMMSNVFFSSGLAHGYKPSGKTAVITETKNIFGAPCVSKINDKNACKAMSELTGVPEEEIKKDPGKVASKYPLGFVDPTGETWVNVYGATLLDNLVFGIKMKENNVFHIMKGKESDIFNAYKEAVDKALKQIGKKKIAAVLIFSCACRNKYFGDKIGKEVDVFKKYFPDVPFVGYYTFAEFGGTLGKRVGIHNQSVTVLVITDELMI